MRDALLEPHRSYLSQVAPLLDQRLVRGIAHITGGGLVDNLPRVLPEGLSATVDLTTWEPPEIFRYLQSRGGVPDSEMYRVFNMGVGMVLFVSRADAEEVIRQVAGGWVLGEVREGDRSVRFVGEPVD